MNARLASALARALLAHRRAEQRKIAARRSTMPAPPPAPCPGGYSCHCDGSMARGRPTVRVEWRHWSEARS